ncbi:hypothetical protein TRFO_34594 [Tritrichomonas foetus]|uniref:MRH domain-containing protein n=1 Tax=Tritrichomonas foetus TaxID=1144522 RepID=A0A1J4JL08_9EUKA|nr:hypothetical protein TRFO_34594 [Tritrichomonas foetus]|eukprot:OHS99095.1 hypothetical protein TRFO_34594 [Tritrichomonas foetus]
MIHLLKRTFPSISTFFLCLCFLAGIEEDWQVKEARKVFEDYFDVFHSNIPMDFSIMKTIEMISKTLNTIPLYKNPEKYLVNNGTYWYVSSNDFGILFSPFLGLVSTNDSLNIQSISNKKEGKKKFLYCKSNKFNPITNQNECSIWLRTSEQTGTEKTYICVKESLYGSNKKCLKFEQLS